MHEQDRTIGEKGASQNGVSSATVATRFGLLCFVHRGVADFERQRSNVFRMKLIGAEILSLRAGHGALRNAMNEAMFDWVINLHDTYIT